MLLENEFLWIDRGRLAAGSKLFIHRRNKIFEYIICMILKIP